MDDTIIMAVPLAAYEIEMAFNNNNNNNIDFFNERHHSTFDSEP